MDVADFDYDLPGDAIAQVPIEPRDAARLLVDQGPSAAPLHRTVTDLPDLVGPGDVVVVNDTRVIPARLRLRKPSGGQIEILLLERRPDGTWTALVRPSRRVPAGTIATTAGLCVHIGEELGSGRRAVTLDAAEMSEEAALARYGEVPLPPYLHEGLADPERYQTVFARWPGSVAAPTAGLHLTTDVISRCRAAGAQVEAIDLAVGLGTFRPIVTADVNDHEMHAERYRVSQETMDACGGAHRVIAVGTTVVRALESAATSGQLEGRTSLFIRAGHRFAMVDALMTNFHVPRSSLLVLIDAFIGPRWHELYITALDNHYRFLSFGDAMLLRRSDGGRQLSR